MRLLLDSDALIWHVLDDARLGAGWHAPEPGWRWTGGAAEIDVAGAGALDVGIGMTERYWAPAPPHAHRAAVPAH